MSRKDSTPRIERRALTSSQILLDEMMNNQISYSQMSAISQKKKSNDKIDLKKTNANFKMASVPDPDNTGFGPVAEQAFKNMKQ